MKRKKVVRKLSLSLVMGGMVMSCVNNKNQKPSKVDIDDSRPTQTVTINSVDCSCNTVLEVLQDGATAVSVTPDDSRSLVVWDITSRRQLGQIFFPMSYQEINSRGTHILRKISMRKYQLIQVKQEKFNNSEIIQINSVTEPIVKFSQNAEYVLIKNTPFYSGRKNQVILYDISKKQYVVSIDMYDINHFSLTRDSRFLIIGQDDRINKSLYKIDPYSEKVSWELPLPLFQNFSELKVAATTVIVKTGYSHKVISLETGKILYNLEKMNLQGISKLGTYAIFTKELNHFVIIELDSGKEIFSKHIPDELYLSSCQLDEDKMVLLCKHKSERDKVFSWELATDNIFSSCHVINN